MAIGVYMHIPFCRRKCDYCGFYSVPVVPKESGPLLDAYIRRLLGEIGRRSSEIAGETADTVFFGGGTPSLLSPCQIENLLERLAAVIRVGPGAEVTMEMNPEDVSKTKLDEYRSAGVNRIVLGYQTSREDFHRAVGRSSVLCDERVLDVFFAASGFAHCLDVMTGLPGQGERDVESELDLICRFAPDHISAYSLAVEEKSPLASRFAETEEFSAAQRKCMEAAMDFLASRGYRQYEISNFALPGRESRHNIKYWTFQPYIGLGPRSHSFFRGARSWVDMTVWEYLESEHIKIGWDRRGRGAMMAEFIMTGLRMADGISLDRMEKIVGKTPGPVLDRIRGLEESGLVAVFRTSGGEVCLRLTREGIFVSDWVIYTIVEDLV